MKQSLRLGKIAGIPIGVNWSVAAILLIITDLLAASVLPAAAAHQRPVVYWSVAVAAAVIFAGSLLVHELAHSVVAVRNGVRVRSITLWMLGGVSELDGEPASPGADLRIALAGPATSAAVAGALWGAAAAISYSGGPRVVVSAALWLALMNGVLAVFNMLPGAPLDGGRVLRAALWHRSGDRVRAAVQAARAGRYVGIGLIAAGIAEILITANLGGLWLMLLGWFIISAARAEEMLALAGSALAGLRIADVMRADPDVAPAWFTVQDFIDTVAARSDQLVFPVVGFNSELTGILLIRSLVRIQPEHRGELRVDQAALPVPAAYLAAPDDPARTLITRPPLGGEVAAVVVVQHRVVGLVTSAELDHLLWRARLGHAPLIGSAR